MTVAYVRADTLCAWKGGSLLVTTPRGECGESHSLSGFYYREARALRTLQFQINGEPLWLCEAASPSTDRLEFSYVHPEISEMGGGGTGQSDDEEKKDARGLPERSLDISIGYRVGVAQLDVELLVTSRAREEVTFTLTCRLDADYWDIQEAQSNRREQRQDLPYQTSIRAEGWTESGDSVPLDLRADVTLRPQETRRLTIAAVPSLDGKRLTDRDVRERDARLERWRRSFTRVEVPGHQLFEDVLRSNIDDVASFPLLDGEADEWLALQAGMPAYPAFFGRDGVTAGWQAGLLDRAEALDAAMTKLRRLQSNHFDDWRDEQPGRIPYQTRSGPLAILNVNPYSAYYADFASPLMYVIALANLFAWTGDERCVERHWDTARRILDWARELGDSDKDGYLEYQTRSSKGTKNQGWKDSGDAIVYDDGKAVPSPIATCELQGYWYLAQELMAVMAVMTNGHADAAAYRKSASELKERFNRDWWVPQENYFALALDPDKQQVRAVSSNVGHCLATGIIDENYRAPVVGRMFAPDLFSGWGIRTLASSHAYYNPLSYHRGTVWAVEQGTIIFGLRRFGFNARALELTRAMFDLALLYPAYRIPECVGGYARGERATPAAYPRANTPQLWNASAFPLALQSMLGLLPLAPLNTLVIDPVLPTWMPEVVLRDMRVGSAKVSLRFWRDRDGASTWDVLHKQGTLHIVKQPPPEARHVGVAARAAALLESL